MIEKTKSASRVGIALVGAFATVANYRRINGNYLGILAHPAGAPLILALCRSKPHGFRLRYLLVLGSDGAEDDGAALRPLWTRSAEELSSSCGDALAQSL